MALLSSSQYFYLVSSIHTTMLAITMPQIDCHKPLPTISGVFIMAHRLMNKCILHRYDLQTKIVGNLLVRGFQRYCPTYGWPLSSGACYNSTDRTTNSCTIYLILPVNRSGARHQRQLPITRVKHLPEIAPGGGEGEGQSIHTESSHSADKKGVLL